MKRMTPWIAGALLASLGGCGGCGGDGAATDAAPDHDAGPPDAGPPTFADCEAGNQAWVRNAFVALVGRRPLGQAEVDVHVDMLDQIEADLLATEEPDAARAQARRIVAGAIMDDPAFVDRWTAYFMDALRVPRIEDQEMRDCYGDAQRTLDDGSLAGWVRDHAAAGAGDGRGAFTMRDLLASALVLDDLSPAYRAHLFALVSRPIPAANVPRVEAELARREDFGNVFMSAYLNRDMVCLGCHNSEGSITYSDDPALNRHWPLPGLFEKALYGDSIGIDTARAHAVFRYDGFVASGVFGDTGDDFPWGWDPACGGFYRSGLEPDPADVDGRFGALTGKALTAFDLEAMLAAGFDALRGGGLVLGSGGDIADPAQALAYLTSAAIAEGLWREVIGTPLTIANYFPRNEASRDVLRGLTETLIANDYSLRAVLLDVVTSEYFNRLPPEAGCGTGPYTTPNVYDPWAPSDDDPARRLNGPGDSVSALPARVLLRAAYAALEWRAPLFEEWPRYSSCAEYSCAQMNNFCMSDGSCCTSHQVLCVSVNEPFGPEEQVFQRGVGVFHKNGERGFRGLDFQARLLWEDRFAACAKFVVDDDFVDRLVADATASGATIEDVVVALKDRLVGIPAVTDAGERTALEAMFGAALGDPATAAPDLEAGARSVCGALLSSPQFLLGGLTAPDATTVPRLTPPTAGYDAVCDAIAARGGLAGYTLTCAGGSLTVQ
jgi:hypothetical protein